MTTEAILAGLYTAARALPSEPGIASRLGARRNLEARYAQAVKLAHDAGLIGMKSKKKWRTL
jgi:hypothetical protein